MSAYVQQIAANVSQKERAFLVEALELLLRERSNALRIATAIARERGDRVPEVQDFGVDDILQLSRQIAESPSVERAVSRSVAAQPRKQGCSMGRRKQFYRVPIEE